MGVPKFYRWLSERYPKINQVITDAALLPEFDHLYLDMNGIIHGCTHPSHMDVSDILSEKDMMLGIMHYIDRIITQIVKPKVSVFMAIDGVAPRAKMNQQRSRRFRSAKDMAEATKDKKPIVTSDGEEQSGGFFDSNCITPGTEFMEKVSNCIKYFIRKKIKEDPLWRNLKVIYSGHDIPGEGEHKIMQHIRDMRNQPGYKPNTRHCMYGQDADLIMLGLVSHEPHFTLLREIVDFGGFQRNANALKAVTKFTKQSDFQLLHLSILREYLGIEFAYGLDPKTYDLERIIDDFVFMTFLVGNDFLPHMPTLDIGDGAFDLLFNTYKEQRQTWGDGQYLTSSGEVSDAARLEAFLCVIGAAETEIFEMREENEADYIKKKRKWDKRDGKEGGPTDEEIAATEAAKLDSYDTMIQDLIVKHGSDAKFVDGWKLPEEGKKDFKGLYYHEKLKFTPIDIDSHLALRKSYIEGLIWCLAYYYRGCISWGWFYPYHYGPLISDLTDLPRVLESIKFDVGEPLKPFEQLMGCLPPASAAIVPKPYRALMLSSDSPIIQFYPTTFEIDMNGKKNPWEGVNILPFIDVNLLKSTIFSRCPDKLLSAEERRRNSVGKIHIYSYDDTVNDTVPSFNRDIGILDIPKCHSRVDSIDAKPDEHISFKPELINGTTIPYPGFPSLGVLPIVSSDLVPIGLNCFGSSSKYSTMVLTLETLPEMPGADDLADSILGKHLFINWPMMHEAKVVAISDSKCEVRVIKNKKKIHTFKPDEAQRWQEESDTMKGQYLNGSGVPGSGGVSIGDIQIRLKLLPLQGMKTSAANGSKKKLFGTTEADVPLQMVLLQSPAPDPRFEERGPMTLKDRFPPKSTVVVTKGKYRGCTGSVLSVVDDDKVGVKVKVFPPEPPFGLAIARSIQESYISFTDAAKVLKLHPTIFAKITGSLFFNPGRYDLGLNLRYQNDMCVLGYTRRRDILEDLEKNSTEAKKEAWGSGDTVLVVGNQESDISSSSKHGGNGKGAIWEYTPKAIRLVAAYKQRFPLLFAAISNGKKVGERSYEASDLGPNGEEELKKIREWLNNVETAKLPRTPCSTVAMPVSAVAAVQRAADVRVASLEQNTDTKELNVKIPASALYREGSTSATDVLQVQDSSSPELGDRIVNLCANGLPFGARGTVVGIHAEKTGCVEVVMDEEFIGGSTLQGACSNFRGKLAVWNHLLMYSPSNSKEVVEQMIPSGSGKLAIQKILENSQEDDAFVTDKNTEEGDKVWSKVASPPQRNPTPSRSSNNKQGTWKEAKGPPKNGVGFTTTKRSVKSGVHAWKKLVKTSNNESKDDTATAGLKAILGVGVTPSKVNDDPTTGLKNMLGIATSLPQIAAPSFVMPGKATQSNSSSAASALMQMLASGPAESSGPIPSQQSVPSGFNFTYVKEGEQPPPQPIVTPSHMYPNSYPNPQMNPMVYSSAIDTSAPIPVNREKKSGGGLIPAHLASKGNK